MVAKHSARFLQAPEAVQKGLRQRAVATALARASEVAADLEHTQAALALRADREMAAADSVIGNRPQLLLSVCKLGQDEIAVLDHMFLHSKLSAQQLAGLRQMSLDAPAPPTLARQSLL